MTNQIGSRPAPTPTLPQPSNADHLRSLIYQSVILSGGQSTGRFTAKSFGLAVQSRFALASVPGDEWVRMVLGGVGWVVEMPGGMGVWKRQTG